MVYPLKSTFPTVSPSRSILPWTTAFSATVEKGFVVGSDPKAGAKVLPGQEITVIVSKGAQPVNLPDLRGKTRDEAEQQLRSLGLSAQFNEQDVTDNNQIGKVITQSPGAGQVSAGSSVMLTIGKGQPKVQVPDLRNRRFDEAKQLVEQAGLKIRREFDGPRGRDRVFAQFPPAGTEVAPGSEVRVFTD